MDLNGQWVSGDRGSKLFWNKDHYSSETHSKRGLHAWQVRRDVEQHFTEREDRAEWGSLHFVAPDDVTYEAGVSADVRHQFASTGGLRNQTDTEFRSIQDAEPVFAFSKSFHKSNGSQSITFTIAHIQDEVVQYASARGLTMMRPLWKSYLAGSEEMLLFHHFDFPHARAMAEEYAIQLAKDANESGAEDYVDIVALSARQVLGATSFSGTADNPLLFLKEISSNGNFQTIDVIFPAFPFFLYTNPRWMAYLLEPLIEHMLSGQYPNKYAMHDLGTHFPNATGHADGKDEYMPVEECGNILIMGLALANSMRDERKTSTQSNWSPMSKTIQRGADVDAHGKFPLIMGQSDGVLYLDEAWVTGSQGLKQAQRWVGRSYTLWKQWTGYLVEFALRPHNQLSTDDFAGWLALQTNLALKGIIGIKAMAGLAEIVEHSHDVKTYNNISETYITKWQEYGISRDKTHAKLAYDWYGSWTTTYNLYADSLLCFHLESKDDTDLPGFIHDAGVGQQLIQSEKNSSGFVPKEVYQMQSTWYYNVRQKYGLPLDSRHLYTKTDWEFFAMAVASKEVRSSILQSVAKWVNETSTDRPLTDLHKTEGTGEFPGPNFFARPVVGGHFAFLTLGQACGGKAGDLADSLEPPVMLDVMEILSQDAK